MGETHQGTPEDTTFRKERGPFALAVEAIKSQLSSTFPVRVFPDGLNGDLLGDVKKTVEVCAGHGGVIVLWGTTRSGKTSIIRTMAEEYRDQGKDCRVVDARSNTQTLLDTVFKNQLVTIDEIDTLKAETIEELVIRLLGQGNTLLVTNHLGNEVNGDIYRHACSELRLPHSRIRMVSRDKRNQGTRIEKWFDCLVGAAIDEKPNLEETIRQIKLNPEVATRLGEITACRPYEASNLMIDIFNSLIVSGSQVITPETVEMVWSKQRKDQGIVLWHHHLLARLYQGEPDGLVEVAPKLDRPIYRAYDLIGRIIKGESVDRLAVTTLLGNYLDKSGLGFIGFEDDKPYIIGEWLAKDWGKSLEVG